MRACEHFHYAHSVSCSALLEHFSVCLQQVCPSQYSADFTLLQVQVKYMLTRHCHSSENQLKLPELTITVNEDYFKLWQKSEIFLSKTQDNCCLNISRFISSETEILCSGSDAEQAYIIRIVTNGEQPNNVMLMFSECCSFCERVHRMKGC